MNTKLLVGILLVVIGVMALAYQGITYTKREKVLDIGPIEATTEREETVPIPPLIGIAVLAGGIVLIVAGVRSRAVR